MGLEDRTRYDPGESEERIFARWMDSGRFHPERFDREAVGRVGGVEAEPASVPLRIRNDRGFELEPGRDDVNRLDALDVATAHHLSRPRPGRRRAEGQQKDDHVSLWREHNPYRIIAATSGFSVSVC